MRIAAVQLQTVVGDAASNIAAAEARIEEAFDCGARIVALPEFFTGAIAPRPETSRCVLPSDNRAIDMMQRLARRHRGWIGGSMLVEDGGEIYNRYVLVGPDEEKFQHDKDLPTMWEGAYYRGGIDDGVFDTALGGIGTAVCWELIRCQTIRRLRGRVGLALTGTHWWTMPRNWPRPLARALAPLGQFNRYLSEQAPVEFARRLGAPVVQASHCGELGGRFRLWREFGVDYQTQFVGATQIIDRHGKVLASRSTEEGPGTVYASVPIGAGPPVSEDAMDRYWVPDLPVSLKAYWFQQNSVSELAYRRIGRHAGIDAAKQHRRVIS